MNNKESRQSFLGDDSDEVFKSSKIAVIGLCGGGSHVSQQLAHIGFTDILLFDFDIVEYSNLHRMIGSCPQDADDKVKKTVVIERLIKHINPDASVQKVDDKWQNSHVLLRECAAVIGCVDSIQVREELERYCRRFLIPYIDIGMDVHEAKNGFSITGQVITSLPHSPCMRCLGYITDEKLSAEQNNYGSAGGKPQVVWPNGVLASIAIGQLIAILTPWNSDMKISAMIEYDGNRQITKPSAKLTILEQKKCEHFDGDVGDPFFASNK